MTMLFQRSVTTSVAAFTLFLFSSATSFSATDTEITEALTAILKGGVASVTVDLGTPTTEDGNLVYSNATIKEGPSTTTIGTITVTGGDVVDGGLTAESIDAENMETVSDGSVAKVESIEITNPDIKLPSKPDATDGRAKFESLIASKFSFTQNDGKPVTIDEFSVVASDFDENIPRSAEITLSALTIDPTSLDTNDSFSTQIKSLGYETIVLNLFGSAKWSADAGEVDVEELSIDGVDIGSLSLAVLLGGVTKDLVAQMQAPGGAENAISKITVNEASLTYEDASLAGRVLDQQAKGAGQSRESFVEQITAAIPLLVTVIGNPAFQNKVSTAASSFLKDPMNLTIYVAPEKPVPLSDIAIAGQTAPQTLPDLLNVDVTANEADDQ
jgi:hypothetical protein